MRPMQLAIRSSGAYFGAKFDPRITDYKVYDAFDLLEHTEPHL